MEDIEITMPAGIPQSAEPGDAMQAPALPQHRPSDDAPSAGERVRTVPYGALAEERARRKELQRELQESAVSRERLQERLDALHALANEKLQMLPESPDPGLAAMPAIGSDLTGEPEPTRANDAFRTQVLRSVRAYAAEQPDFLDAYQHARQARVEELVALGYAENEALAITFDNELEVINAAFAAGQNPAQIIHDFAVRRGFRSARDGQPSATAHAQPPVMRPAGNAASMSEAEKIALAARGQAASKSLSAAGGGATGTLTLEALAGMSDDEFAEATKGDRWHRLLRS